MYKVNVTISYGEEHHHPGDEADLAGWPADDLARFEREGIITAVVAAPPVPPKPPEIDYSAASSWQEEK